MYYTIYKITNQINGKFYIGSHKTKDLNDAYMGSGKYLKHAQEKYGIENFTKEILFVFDTPEEMYAKEAEIVNEDFLAEENTYNLKIGGFGGWHYINSNDEFRIAKNKKARQAANASILEKHGASNSSQLPSARNKLSASMRTRIASGFSSNPPSFAGKKHSEETKQKMKDSHAGKHVGEKNSQFGTVWITDGNINKKIRKDATIPDGFFKGKVQNNKREYSSEAEQFVANEQVVVSKSSTRSNLSRGTSAADYQAHNLEDVGSSPTHRNQGSLV
jgi:hypothetical protein